jgi:hypothetical protein
MCYGIQNTYMLCISIHYVYQCYVSIALIDNKILLKVYKISFERLLKWDLYCVTSYGTVLQ